MTGLTHFQIISLVFPMNYSNSYLFELYYNLSLNLESAAIRFLFVEYFNILF